MTVVLSDNTLVTLVSLWRGHARTAFFWSLDWADASDVPIFAKERQHVAAIPSPHVARPPASPDPDPKKIRAGKSVKPMLEILEDRIAPTVSLAYVPQSFSGPPTITTGSLYIAAANSASNINVSHGTSGWQFQLTGDTFGTLPTGFTQKTTGSTYTVTTTKPMDNLYIGGPGTFGLERGDEYGGHCQPWPLFTRGPVLD